MHVCEHFWLTNTTPFVSTFVGSRVNIVVVLKEPFDLGAILLDRLRVLFLVSKAHLDCTLDAPILTWNRISLLYDEYVFINLLFMSVFSLLYYLLEPAVFQILQRVVGHAALLGCLGHQLSRDAFCDR